MDQKSLQIKMAYQNTFVYWSNISCFETAPGHSISFPAEFTVKQNPFLFMSDVLKGGINLYYKRGSKEKLPNKGENESNILTSQIHF